MILKFDKQDDPEERDWVAWHIYRTGQQVGSIHHIRNKYLFQGHGYSFEADEIHQIAEMMDKIYHMPKKEKYLVK